MSKPRGRKNNYKNKADNKKAAKVDQNYTQDEEIRLNKFIAHAGFVPVVKPIPIYQPEKYR